MNRFAASLVAGGAAIILNTLALKVADYVPLTTARGGLLRLVRQTFPGAFRTFSDLWTGLGGPATGTPIFQSGFHLWVGLLMALFYTYLLEPSLPGRPVAKGLIYAAGAWLLNAAYVLPATGEGFAGSAHLSLAGMIWFAAAHTLFFVLSALFYAALRRR